MHRFSPNPHRLQGQKVKSHGAGAYCGGHLAAQLVPYTLFIASNTAYCTTVHTRDLGFGANWDTPSCVYFSPQRRTLA